MINHKPWNVPVKFGNAGTQKVCIVYSAMKKQIIPYFNFEDVLYLPDLYLDLFSMTMAINNPYLDALMTCDDKIVLIINNRQELFSYSCW